MLWVMLSHIPVIVCEARGAAQCFEFIYKGRGEVVLLLGFNVFDYCVFDTLGYSGGVISLCPAHEIRKADILVEPSGGKALQLLH